MSRGAGPELIYSPDFFAADSMSFARALLEKGHQMLEQQLRTLFRNVVAEAGLRTDLAPASLARFDRALAQGHGAKDMSASFLVD